MNEVRIAVDRDNNAGVFVPIEVYDKLQSESEELNVVKEQLAYIYKTLNMIPVTEFQIIHAKETIRELMVSENGKGDGKWQ